MDPDIRPLTVGEWMVTLLILAIPLVNLIMYLIWALSDSGNLNRKRFCQASLIWFLIIVGASITFGLMFGLLGMFAALL